MARDLTASVITQLQSASVEVGILFEGEFASGWVRLWSGIGTLSWDSKTWTGTGNLLGISGIDETAEVRAAGLTVSLSGVPSDLLSAALGDARSGRIGRVYGGAVQGFGDEMVAPDRHPAVAMAGDLGASVDRVDHAFCRKEAAIPFRQEAQVRRALGEEFAHDPVTASCLAVADNAMVRVDRGAEGRVLRLGSRAERLGGKCGRDEQMLCAVHDPSS